MAKPTHKIQVSSIPADVFAALLKQAKAEHVSISTLARQIIAQHYGK